MVAVEAKRTYRFCTDLLFDEFLNFNCTRLKIQIDAKHCWLEILKWQHFWNLSLIISYPGGQVQVTQCGHLSRYFSCSFKGWKPEARAADLVAADCGESGGSLDPVGSLALQILWKAASLVLGWLGFLWRYSNTAYGTQTIVCGPGKILWVKGLIPKESTDHLFARCFIMTFFLLWAGTCWPRTPLSLMESTFYLGW